MTIKILEDTDNIQEYIDTVKELNSSTVSLSTIEEIKNAINERPSNILTFVMVNDGVIVASATIIVEKKLRYKQLCYHIEDVGVHPDNRGKGYGKEIVNYCIRTAKENNCYKLKLSCNNSLVDFYSQLGFVSNGDHMFYENINMYADKK